MSSFAAFIVIVGTVLLAAFAAGSETAVVSCSKVRLHTRAKAGLWRARTLEVLINSPEHFFSIVLVTTNLAVIVCTAAATELAVQTFGHAGAEVATAVMVPILLIFGEVIPKSVFLYHADRVAVAVAPAIKILEYVLWPLIMPVTLLVRLLLRAAGAGNKRFDILSTREELVHLYRTGKKEGAIERRERLIIDRVFRFGGVQVIDLMIPMERVVSIPVTASVDEVIAEANKHTYSRFPIVSPSDRRIVGIVSLFDLLGLDGGEKLTSVMHRPLYAKGTETAEKLLVVMKDEPMHMAVVVGDRGEMRGIVTLETILENIIGDIEGDYQASSPPSSDDGRMGVA
ncbi:MAG: CNNM domain-containing protein [Candidatus Krumholzibacteria bacterium]|nr:CNNM domain-containing protein [Candidatus Krumholzibacteria bacterium]